MTVNFDNLDLDTLRSEAEGKYKDLVVQGVVFRGPMRMTKAERKEFQRLLTERDAGEGELSDVVDFYRDMLMIAAADKEAATDLFNQVGDDATVLDVMLTLYFKRTQAGEA
jgi:hypothetical protein